MTHDDNDALALAEGLIRVHEGERLFPYSCTADKMTIGIGRNLTDRGITRAEMEFLYENDLKAVRSQVRHLSYWGALDQVRRAAIMDMCFQLGWQGLLGFKKMHQAMELGDWQEAYVQCLDSRYAEQTPTRAKKIAKMLLSGEVE